jgi:hypothetical protein
MALDGATMTLEEDISDRCTNMVLAPEFDRSCVVAGVRDRPS